MVSFAAGAWRFHDAADGKKDAKRRLHGRGLFVRQVRGPAIDDTPLLSDFQRRFYKTDLAARHEALS